MTLQELFDLAIETGIRNDPRDKKEITRLLKDEKKAFEKLDAKEKKFFDRDRLKNPYSDSRIYCGDRKKKIKKIAVGIDLDGVELLTVDRLNERGAKIDLALTHHPEGIALARLSDVMSLQSDLFASHGVPINVIEKLMDPEIARVERGVHAINHEKAPDIARAFGIAYANTHTPADNSVMTYLAKKCDKKQPRTVGDLIELLMDEPEYVESAARGIAPEVFVGSKKSRAGKVIFSGFTGGTSGSKHSYAEMKAAGIGTEVVMHIPEESRKEAEKHHINVVVAGHIASDSIGMNLLIDEFEKRGVKEIVELGGFRRFRRGK